MKMLQPNQNIYISKNYVPSDEIIATNRNYDCVIYMLHLEANVASEQDNFSWFILKVYFGISSL